MLPTTHRVWIALTLLTLGLTSQAEAQELKWRGDYAAARKEATTSGRPLLLDFGTEACVWCRKLDATTFRAPAVVAAIHDRFVPVKIDAEKEAWLARAAGVESYPTLVLLAADGKIIGRHVGYADVAQLTALLGKAPVVAPSPAKPDGPAELLALAVADHDAGHYLACLQRCDHLAGVHPECAQAGEARRLASRIAADPDKLRRVKAQLDADLTALHPKLADPLP